MPMNDAAISLEPVLARDPAARTKPVQCKPPVPFRDDAVDDLVSQVRAIRPLLMSEAEVGETQRSPTGAAIAALDQIGLWNLMVPRRWGGKGFSTSGFARVQRELAKGDPAVAWVSHVINSTSWTASLLPDVVQEALFAGRENTPRICGAFNPPGTARAVAGGYRVSGAWPYTSGSRQADWIQGSVETADDQPNKPRVHLVYIAAGEIDIADSWYVTGMQGTGSDTSVARDVFVPKERCIAIDEAFASDPAQRCYGGAASDYLPALRATRATMAAQFVGAAEAMLEMLCDNAGRRGIVGTSYRRQSDAPVFQHHLGEAAAKIDTAALLVEAACADLDARASAGLVANARELAQSRGRTAIATKLIVEAMEQMMTIAGSAAFALANPMQRYWRDVSVATRHIGCLPHIGYEILGRELMGVSPNIMSADGF